MMQLENLSPIAQQCLQDLLREWLEFERKLGQVPIIQRLEQRRLHIDDYRLLLLNLRQQVVEGARWICRTASSFDHDYADVRASVIEHAQDEHRDYEMLEQDYVAADGELDTIRQMRRNAGSEALHGFLMYRASQPNPTDLIGAMWIIEGLGNKMAADWADIVDELYGSSPVINRFMRYHADNDAAHLDKLYLLLERVCQTEQQRQEIVRTARVVARLYQLQLEEIDHG
jgi:3-oxoacyl-[acyl-carrier-protein] synthase-3